jgi:hypothetical protein
MHDPEESLFLSLISVSLVAPTAEAQDELADVNQVAAAASATAEPTSSEGAPFDVTVIFTDLATSSTTLVPGYPGVRFSSFDRPYGSPIGNWFARGNNDTTEQDWVVRNGVVAAAIGDPIYTGATELWDDTDCSSGFFLHVGNSGSDWVIGGVSDGPTESNGVPVANGTVEVVRENDPLDIDGNGLFDDSPFINTFGNDDAVLTDDRTLYIVVTMRDVTGASIGDAFLSVDLSSIPVELMSFSVE